MNTSIVVQNLKFGGCANTISTKLSTITSISNLQIDLDQSKLSFNYLNEGDLLQVKEKLKQLGYPTVEDGNSSVLKAKSFVSCATGKLSK